MREHPHTHCMTLETRLARRLVPARAMRPGVSCGAQSLSAWGDRLVVTDTTGRVWLQTAQGQAKLLTSRSPRGVPWVQAGLLPSGSMWLADEGGALWVASARDSPPRQVTIPINCVAVAPWGESGICALGGAVEKGAAAGCQWCVVWLTARGSLVGQTRLNIDASLHPSLHLDGCLSGCPWVVSPFLRPDPLAVRINRNDVALRAAPPGVFATCEWFSRGLRGVWDVIAFLDVAVNPADGTSILLEASRCSRPEGGSTAIILSDDMDYFGTAFWSRTVSRVSVDTQGRFWTAEAREDGERLICMYHVQEQA